jgi:hypothetical protein
MWLTVGTPTISQVLTANSTFRWSVFRLWIKICARRRSIAHWWVISLVLVSASPARADDGAMPNARLTPGARLAANVNDICVHGYTHRIRNVPASVKREVYAAYGIENVPGEHELDHLIPLELGGSNARTNLWPEPYAIYWNAHVKDGLERKLHNEVCAGEISLSVAQEAIATDWIAAYKRYMGHLPAEHAR